MLRKYQSYGKLDTSYGEVQEMSMEEDKEYLTQKHELTKALSEFCSLCVKQGRNVRNEIEDCICEAGGDDS